MGVPTVARLAQLHGRLLHAQRRVTLCGGLWQGVQREAQETETAMVEEVPWPVLPRSWNPAHMGLYGYRALQWYWRTQGQWGACKLGAVLCGLMSLVLMVSMCLIWAQDFLPLGAILRSIGVQNTVAIFVVSCLPLSYMVFCQTRGLFHLRLFGWSRLADHQQSDASPLLFNASYLIRLQFPLCYNFLLLIGDTEIGRVAFENLMISMEVVPILGTSFNVYAPIIMVIPAFLTMCRCYSRLLTTLGMSHEDADEWGGEDELEEGRVLLRRAQEQKAQEQEEEDDDSIKASYTDISFVLKSRTQL